MHYNDHIILLEFTKSYATVFDGAADAVAVIDEVVGVPKLFYFE